MSATDLIIAQWYFHVPNLILAALMYTLLGRFVLSFFFASESKAVIWRVFNQVTDPWLRIVGFVTPRVVPWPLILILSVMWVFVLRIVLLFGLSAAGFGPAIGG